MRLLRFLVPFVLVLPLLAACATSPLPVGSSVCVKGTSCPAYPNDLAIVYVSVPFGSPQDQAIQIAVSQASEHCTSVALVVTSDKTSPYILNVIGDHCS